MIDTELREVTAMAPATVSNVAVGFDILGFSLEGGSDRVTVRRRQEPGVDIVNIVGDVDVPAQARHNSATAGLIDLLEERNASFGLDVEIAKGVPLHSGLGGSAASAVAGVVAASAVMERPLSLPERFRYALRGEQQACGKRRGDNIAPALLGGLILVRSLEPFDVLRIPVPHDMGAVVAVPELQIEVQKAREILAESIELDDFVAQSANLGAFIGGCFGDDRRLIGHSLQDLIVEPQRSHLIPGFAEVQRAALEAGALGCSISGAGPAMFAIHDFDIDPETLCQAMKGAFTEAGIDSLSIRSPLNGIGAHITERHR